MAHTKGPWILNHHSGNNAGHYDGYQKSEISAGEGHTIYVRQSVSGKTFPELSATASSDLLEAAYEILNARDYCRSHFNINNSHELLSSSSWVKLEKAIAKAEGRE